MADEISNNTFQNKISEFTKKNLKNLFFFSIVLILILFGYFFYQDLQKKNAIKLSEDYTKASIQFKEKNIDISKKLMENIIDKKHKFYSPLALYFIIDKNLELEATKVINLFDKILSINSIEDENLNLIKIKKAIFLFDLKEEKLIIQTLNPIINSDSVWRTMAIELISDYFLSNNQKIKANEFLQLLNNKNRK